MTKRVVSALLCIGLLMASVTNLTVYAQDEPDLTALETAAKVEEDIPARSAILIEQSTGMVLFEKNADEILPPASITKIMTLLLTMEAIENGKIKLDDMAVCSEYAMSMGGSQIWLKAGEQMSVDDLLKAVAISSANDASVVLAEHIAGSESAFVEQMNTRAKELGMENTNFVNCSGLDAEGHLTTARDIAAMSRVLLNYEKITDYSSIWMADLRGGETQLVNTNKLVRFYSGCNGLKTGTTNDAGSCLSASASRKGMTLISVTLGSPTSAERFSAARGLLDYGFANFMKLDLPPAEGIVPVPVKKGTAPAVDVESEPLRAVIVKVNDKANIRQEVTLEEELAAPVKQGQIIGKVTVYANDEVIHEYALFAAADVEKMTFAKAFATLFGLFVKM